MRNLVETANQAEENFAILQAAMANYVGQKLDVCSVNDKLYKDCLKKADGELLGKADTATVILRVLWDRLKKTYSLRFLNDLLA